MELDGEKNVDGMFSRFRQFGGPATKKISANQRSQGPGRNFRWPVTDGRTDRRLATA